MVFSMKEMIIRVLLVLLIALLLTIGTVLVVKWIQIDIRDVKQRTGPNFLLIAFVSNLLFIYAVQLLLKLLDKQNISAIGFSFSIIDWVYSLIFFILTILTAFIIVFWRKKMAKDSIQFAGQKLIPKGEVLTFLLAFIVLFVAAVQEEVLFRAYFKFLFQRSGKLTALLVSTVIFTVWHFIGNKVHLYQTIEWLIGGMLFLRIHGKRECVGSGNCPF